MNPYEPSPAPSEPEPPKRRRRSDELSLSEWAVVAMVLAVMGFAVLMGVRALELIVLNLKPA